MRKDLNDPALKGFLEFERKPDHQYYLALVGDIGSPLHPTLEPFLEKVSKLHDQVFYVAGNHEYYNKSRVLDSFYTISQIQTQIKQITSKFPNVHFMENNVFQIDEYKVIGCTLWSDISDGNALQVERALNDYRLIAIDDNTLPKGKRVVNAKDTTFIHKNSIAFIKQQLEMSPQTPCLVLTHHSPMFTQGSMETADPQYGGIEKAINHGFHTDLTKFIENHPNIKAWIFGHTHWSCKFQYSKTLIASNQLGYNFSGENAFFDTFESLLLPYSNNNNK
ncbi:hypothetical protein DLAC_03591 [Tieghemostelium lacteum]|uniref:Calcineurin-like phosphoesterase domain-containing protein n=1 Tax=Tieghemostelium lacteum TaxID=361077 RepID=A0A152A0P7_TIELA|nr:hypothetical protein DLAC_03591 [Tieghemostelium lacteum]|eukprot:KYQ99654.1 hypothetical protein DLAC_03591 [Tieghemostelium lacteum]